MNSREAGGQRIVRRAPHTLPLDALSTVVGIVLLAEILLANVGKNDPDRLRLVGAPTAAALLTACLIARVLRADYARATLPLLRSLSQWVMTSDLAADRDSARYRAVTIKNVGVSTAVFASVRWEVGAAAAGESSRTVETVVELHALLRSLGFEEGRDYAISNYSPGTALGANEQRLYFECTPAFVDALGSFSAVFQFESLLGDRFEKAVQLLPRPGAPSTVSNPAPRAVA